MRKRENMVEYEAKLVGTRYHELMVVPSNLLLQDSGQNKLFGVDWNFILRDRPPDGPVVLARDDITIRL